MKIKFIKENPNYEPRWIGAIVLPSLVFGEIYETKSTLDDKYYYNINELFYPINWFEIIEL